MTASYAEVDERHNFDFTGENMASTILLTRRKVQNLPVICCTNESEPKGTKQRDSKDCHFQLFSQKTQTLAHFLNKLKQNKKRLPNLNQQNRGRLFRSIYLHIRDMTLQAFGF